MKVDFHAVNFAVDQKLLDFIQGRMDKLERVYDKVVYSDVFLKLDNTSSKENKIVELKVHVPGDSLIVKKQAKSFEEGADSAINSLDRVLIKRKEKIK